MESFQAGKADGTEAADAAVPHVVRQSGLSFDGSSIPLQHKTLVTILNSILTSEVYHVIIKIIVTVFSLENKVTVLQSVKWRYCAVWHFFCFLSQFHMAATAS